MPIRRLARLEYVSLEPPTVTQLACFAHNLSNETRKSCVIDAECERSPVLSDDDPSCSSCPPRWCDSLLFLRYGCIQVPLVRGLAGG